MHTQTFTSRISCARVIDDALLQAMTYMYIKHMLIQFFGVMKFCRLDSIAATFLIKYCSLLGSDLNC